MSLTDMIITVHVNASIFSPISIALNVTPTATVDWTNSGVFAPGLTYTYTVSGSYIISIRGATQFNYSATLNEYLIEVVQWGLGITDYSTAFQNCPNNFTLPSTQLTGVTLMNSMFQGCQAFNQPVYFDTSIVENMAFMFYNCSIFNQPISFDTSNVTTMAYMFQGCILFNQPITMSIQGLTPGTSGSLSPSLYNIFYQCGMDITNYSATLIAWAAQTPNYINVIEVSGPLGNYIPHSIDANNAYVELTSTPPVGHGWSITDGGSTTDMIITVNVPATTTITLNVDPTATVDWTNSGVFAPGLTYTYTVGNYTISIRGATRFNYSDTLNPHLTSVVQWGDGITDYSNAFQYCLNNFTLPLTPLTGVTNMILMFQGCYVFNQPISFDTSQVTNMLGMFYECSVFNQPISFDTSQVTSMEAMFQGCIAFNQSISFDTSQVENMQYMFFDCLVFNQPISFDTSLVENMQYMFFGCGVFNQPLSFDTSLVTTMAAMFQQCFAFNQPISFDTSNVTTMAYMFQQCFVFNQPISFDTSNVTTMAYMFQQCYNFNQTITMSIQGLTPGTSGSLSPSLQNIFYHGGMDITNYSATLMAWAAQTPNYINVGEVSDSLGNYIPHSIDANNAYVELTSTPLVGHGWSITDGGSNTDMIITVNVLTTTSITLNVNPTATVDWTNSTVFTSGLTHTYTVGNYTISIRGATQFNYSATLSPHLTSVVQWGSITDYSTAFQNCPNYFTLPLTQLTSVTLMNGMFRGCSAFNRPISFDTSLVTTMADMFYECSVFNQPISFDTSQVTIMTAMFQGCIAFNQPISFDTSQVTTMASMFYECSVFDQPISFDTSQVTSMEAMFEGCIAFNQPISFDTSLVTTMGAMFQGCSVFNQPVNFNTSQVTIMTAMFQGCIVFNRPISFDTSLVTNMAIMFQGCNAFNQPISFDLSLVENMQNMFQNCTSLNSTISFTNTSLVENISFMFIGCYVFNQPIFFDTSNVTTMESMFEQCYNFNQTITMSIQGLTPGTSGSLSPSLQNIFYHGGMDITNYSATLMAWAAQTPNYINVGEVSDSLGNYIPHSIDANNAYVELTSTPLVGHGWSITDGGSNTDMIITVNVLTTTSITLNVNPTATVDWTNSTVFTSGLTHTYTVGNYTISIRGATQFNYSATLSPHLTGVVQWGGITDYSTAFQNCPNNFTLPLTPLTGVTNMQGMFQGCSAFNRSISFDTSLVTTMAAMFQGCTLFNQPLSFDTSLVTTMAAMFQGCTLFNQPLSFDTIQVTTMDSMFQYAVSFARPLNTWKLNSLVSMNQIFTRCGFNQSIYSATLNGWASQSMYLQLNVNVGTVSNSNNALICHTNAVQAYNLLIGLGWSILDGGDCTNAPCFLKGTHILTPNGYVRIEKLYAGDLVLTHDGRKVPICKMHRSHPTPSPITLPYCIPKGTPIHSRKCLDDLYLSPEHAILIHSNKMVAMKYTTFQQVKLQSIHYYHIILPNYYTDTLIANGIVCESYSSAKKYNLHDGKYRTLISPYTYYNLIEPSQYIM